MQTILFQSLLSFIRGTSLWLGNRVSNYCEYYGTPPIEPNIPWITHKLLIFSRYKTCLHFDLSLQGDKLLKMQLREVGQYDLLTNLLVKSKGLLESTVGNDHKLNYNKIYDNPKEYEISYVDALANLEEINDLFRKRINEKNKHYNFFLDESDNPSQETPISLELYSEYQQFLQKGEIFCYTTKNTWTKGKDFFFIQKGTVMKIVQIYEDRVFADLSYHGKVGLMKLAELKIILSNPDNDAEQ